MRGDEVQKHERFTLFALQNMDSNNKHKKHYNNVHELHTIPTLKKMTFIRNGYIARRAIGTGRLSKKHPRRNNTYKDWWLIKARTLDGKVTSLSIKIGQLTLPPEIIGKKIRFKLEIIEEEAE